MLKKKIKIPQEQLNELVSMLKIISPDIGFSGYKLDIALIAYFNKYYNSEIIYKLGFLSASDSYIIIDKNNTINISELISELLDRKIIEKENVKMKTIYGVERIRRMYKII